MEMLVPSESSDLVKKDIQRLKQEMHRCRTEAKVLIETCSLVAIDMSGTPTLAITAQAEVRKQNLLPSTSSTPFSVSSSVAVQKVHKTFSPR